MIPCVAQAQAFLRRGFIIHLTSSRLSRVTIILRSNDPGGSEAEPDHTMWEMTRRHNRARLASLTLANILIPIAVWVFASGFFPYKPYLQGLATWRSGLDGADATSGPPEAIFDKVVFMVVDALRSDFVYGHGSGFEFTQEYVRPMGERGAADED